jgi:prepilin-type N-terminal cleavage/methylation domain-containing protein
MSLRFVRRGAFTLIELLVAMSIIVVLASLTLLVVVNMSERDGTTDAAGLTRQWLMIAKNRASRDGAPRGLRLVVATDPNNIAKASPFWVTECQYIEAPPILVTYPAQNNNFTPSGSPSDPAVVFTYSTSVGPPTHPQPVGAILPGGKTCQIVNLRQSEAVQVQANSILQLPVIGTWHRITGTPIITQQGASTFYTVTVALDSFPDSQMGAAGVAQPQPQPAAGSTPPCYITQLFGITSPPRPLLAEPPLPLPRDICIDLTPSSPRPPVQPNPNFIQGPSFPDGTAASVEGYDILFAPNGNVLPVGAGAQADGMIFLWHRDYTKLRNNAPNGNFSLVITNNPFVAPFPVPVYDMYPFQNGGEQQIVAIRCKSGALGQFPVQWPSVGGQYAIGGTPYDFARTGTTSP